jgi:hypothetical protein
MVKAFGRKPAKFLVMNSDDEKFEKPGLEQAEARLRMLVLD